MQQGLGEPPWQDVGGPKPPDAAVGPGSGWQEQRLASDAVLLAELQPFNCLPLLEQMLKIKREARLFHCAYASVGWHLVRSRVLCGVQSASALCEQIFLMGGKKCISKMLFLNKAWQGIQDKVQCRS